MTTFVVYARLSRTLCDRATRVVAVAISQLSKVATGNVDQNFMVILKSNISLAKMTTINSHKMEYLRSTTSCSGTTKVVVTPPVTLPAFSLTSGQVAVPFQVCSTGPLKTVTIQNRAGTCVGDQVVAVYNSAGTAIEVYP